MKKRRNIFRFIQRDFYRWIAVQRRSAVCGDAKNCVLSRFLEATGMINPVTRTARYGSGAGTRLLPQWARYVVRTFDAHNSGVDLGENVILCANDLRAAFARRA